MGSTRPMDQVPSKFSPWLAPAQPSAVTEPGCPCVLCCSEPRQVLNRAGTAPLWDTQPVAIATQAGTARASQRAANLIDGGFHSLGITDCILQNKAGLGAACVAAVVGDSNRSILPAHADYPFTSCNYGGVSRGQARISNLAVHGREAGTSLCN